MKTRNSNRNGDWETPQEPKIKSETRKRASRKPPGNSSNNFENNGGHGTHTGNRNYFETTDTSQFAPHGTMMPYDQPYPAAFYGHDGYRMPPHMAQFLYSQPAPPPPPEANPNQAPRAHPAAASQPKHTTASQPRQAATSQPHPTTLPQTYPAAPPQQPPTSGLPPFHQAGYQSVPYPNIAPSGWNGKSSGQFMHNFPVNQPPALAPYPYPHPMGPLPQAPHVHQAPPNHDQGFNTQSGRFQQPNFAPVRQPKPPKPPVENMPPCVECGIGLVQQQLQDLLIDNEKEKDKKARRRKQRAAVAAQEAAIAKNTAIVRDEFDRLLKNSVRDVVVRHGDRFRDLDIDPEPRRRASPLEYRWAKTPVTIAQELLDSMEAERAREKTDLTLQQIADLISRTPGLEPSQSAKAAFKHGDANYKRQKHLDSLQAQIDFLEARTASYNRNSERINHNPTFADADFAEVRHRPRRNHSQPPRGRQNDYLMGLRARTPRPHSRRAHNRTHVYDRAEPHDRPIPKTFSGNDSAIGDMGSADMDMGDIPPTTWDFTEHNTMDYQEPHARMSRKCQNIPRRRYQFVDEETYPTYDDMDGFYSDEYEGPAELRPRRARPYSMQYAPKSPAYYCGS